MKPRKLSTLLTGISIFSVVVALTLFTMIEFFIQRDASLSELLTHHLAEAALLGVIIWGVMIFTLQRVLVQPLREIFVNLYAVGRGSHDRLHVDTKVKEISGIVDGINLMLRGQAKSKYESVEDSQCESETEDEG